MAAPYSQDLCLRVLTALDGGLGKMQVHRTFGVSRSTIDDWLKLRAQTGNVQATTSYRHGRIPELTDTPEVHAFVQQHQHHTLSHLITP